MYKEVGGREKRCHHRSGRAPLHRTREAAPPGTHPDEKARKGFESHMTRCAVGENILASMWEGWMNG